MLNGLRNIIGSGLMDPRPTHIPPQLVVVPPQNGFLARVAVVAMRLHGREVDAHRVLVAPRRDPVVLARAGLLERAASWVAGGGSVGSGRAAWWEDGGEERREDQSA